MKKLTAAAAVVVLSVYMMQAMNGEFSDKDRLTGDIDRTMHHASMKTDNRQAEGERRSKAKPEQAEQTEIRSQFNETQSTSTQ